MELPPLPDLDLAARPAAPPLRLPWTARVREALSSYLPLLLMALLALATWWLVKNTPAPEVERPVAAPRHEPDYTMQSFSLQRFDPDGRLRVQVEGQQLRHYPDTDTLEIDTVRIRAYGPDGTQTLATARRAIANGDATEVQLLGGAHVQREADRRGEAIEFEGEFLHAFLDTEKLRSHLPVRLVQGGSEIRAGGLEYDHLSRSARLQGPVRARFIAPPRR